MTVFKVVFLCCLAVWEMGYTVGDPPRLNTTSYAPAKVMFTAKLFRKVCSSFTLCNSMQFV